MIPWQEDWKIMTVRGLCAVLLGLIALLNPGLTLRALVFLFAAYLIVDSTFAYAGSRRIAGGPASNRSRAADLLLGIGAGISTLVLAAVAAIVLLYLFAALAIVTGALALRGACELRRDEFRDWLLVVRCLSLIVFGALLAFYPIASITAFVFLVGLYALIQGILQFGLAYRLYKWHACHEALPAR
jgi:uncharacterized membrane protein HdeD (DUF308 family)